MGLPESVMTSGEKLVGPPAEQESVGAPINLIGERRTLVVEQRLAHEVLPLVSPLIEMRACRSFQFGPGVVSPTVTGMGTTFHGPCPWPHIATALRGPGPRHAAIAYLGNDAPNLLSLRASDVLIVNASRAALRAHATSPTALAYYVDAGVRVLSSPNLYTGVIVTNKQAIVGPSSASHSSTIADEAVLITDDPDAVAAAHKFIDNLDEITEVDQVFIDNAAAIWAIGRIVPLPGIGNRLRAEPDFLPTPINRMFLRHITDYELSPAEEQEWTAQTNRRRSTAGPKASYQLEWLRIGTPSRRGPSRLRRGDVVLQVTADNTWIYPPAVVDSDPIPIPHTRRTVAYLLRTQVHLDAIAVPDANKALADLGHPNPRLHTDHRIISTSLQAALMQLWNL